MGKVKVRIKAGSKGKPLGERIVEYRAKEGEGDKVLYRPKAKLTTHIHYGR